MTLTIDKFGRVLIPKAIRNTLGLELGGEIELAVDNSNKKATLTAKMKRDDEYESEVVFTDWGFPMIKTKEKLPEDFNSADFTKETYNSYFDERFGKV